MPEFEYESEKESNAPEVQFEYETGHTPEVEPANKLHYGEVAHTPEVEPASMRDFEEQVHTPEFEPDEESTSRASALTSRLMENLKMVVEERTEPAEVREIFAPEHYAERVEGVPVADVVENVGRMATEFMLLNQFESDVLCCRLGDGQPAPVSISKLLGGLPAHYPTDAFLRIMGTSPIGGNFVQALLRDHQQQDPSLTFVDVREAEDSTERNLGAFLSYRFAGMKVWNEWIQRFQNFGSGVPNDPIPSEIGPGGGLQVEVFCRTRGLRIHISPAYFIDWVFFGSPTTPVASYVLPGRYIFAGDGPMLPTRVRDEAVFSIPPTYRPSLMRF